MAIQFTLAEGRRVADAIAAHFSDACERLEVAGSVRREAPYVHDVDLVLIPTRSFWSRVGTESAWSIESKTLDPRKTRQVKLRWRDPALKVELWVARPETWGWILMLRTGPDTFCKRLVTVAPDLGGHSFRDGELRRATSAGGQSTMVPTPEEADVFAALGLGEIPVAARSAQAIDDRVRHLRSKGGPR